jgi:hypothetical protein
VTPPLVFVALLHYPVHDRNRRIITSAVSNLDIHDIARISRTYGVSAYFICTPVQAQREHVRNVIGHWEGDTGGTRRGEALALVRVVPLLADAIEEVRQACGGTPFVVATGAARRPGSLTAVEVRRRARKAPALLLCFGTGWGLAEPVFDAADAVLDPIDSGSGYNHLPVRAAVAVVLDRLISGWPRGAGRAQRSAP